MRRVLVVGIGAGDPEHLTLQGVRAIGRADAFLVLDKGEVKADLVDLRRALVAEHGRAGARWLEGRDPDRARVRDGYPGAVQDWRRARAQVTADLLRQVGEDETAALLVWGDPSLFDSTLAILEQVEDVPFDVEVVPGISSVSALCAQHRIPLNRVGRPVVVTTGRRLAEGWPEGVDDVVVMLDAHGAYEGLEGVDVWWGAYVGTPDEVLVQGRLPEAAAAIRAAHDEARARKGWIMDTYLLRRGG